MERYVVGFLFDGDRVLLIRKERPAWQAGRLNGVGGHIEEGESPHEAMTREFREEAGLETDEWVGYARLHRPGDYEVFFFVARRKEGEEVSQKTEEGLEWHVASSLPDDVIPNLKWLVPMALDEDVADVVEVQTL